MKTISTLFALLALVAMTQGLSAETLSGSQTARQLEANGLDSRHARILGDQRMGVLSCLGAHTQCVIDTTGNDSRPAGAMAAFRCSMDFQICLAETEKATTSALRGWTM